MPGNFGRGTLDTVRNGPDLTIEMLDSQPKACISSSESGAVRLVAAAVLDLVEGRVHELHLAQVPPSRPGAAAVWVSDSGMYSRFCMKARPAQMIA